MHAACAKIAIHHQKSSPSVCTVARLVAVAAGGPALSSAAVAFQIAPMGSAFESKLTNETENSLAKAADRLGVLIKGRVHEEITQIGMGCPIEPAQLAPKGWNSPGKCPRGKSSPMHFYETSTMPH